MAWQQPNLLQKNVEGGYDELTPAAASAISSLSARLSALPGIDGPRTRDLQKLLDASLRSRNSRAAMLKIFQGLLIGPDQQTTAVILQLLPPERSGICAPPPSGRFVRSHCNQDLTRLLPVNLSRCRKCLILSNETGRCCTSPHSVCSP
ncbi:MAG UNVERIFIED_CONTAM: hypothetical protein LVR18_05250 [Planctomycetaceae bacterium]